MHAFSSSAWKTITLGATSLTLALAYIYSESPSETALEGIFAVKEMSQSVSNNMVQYGLGILPSLSSFTFFQNVFAAAETIPLNETVDDDSYQPENITLLLFADASSVNHPINLTGTSSSNISVSDTNKTTDKTDTVVLAFKENEKGRSFLEKGEYHRARKAFQKAHDIFQKIPYEKNNQAICLKNIAAAYGDEGLTTLYNDKNPSGAKDLLQRSIQYYEKALEKWRDNNSNIEEWLKGKGISEYEMGVALNSEAVNLTAKKDYTESIQKQLESIKYFERSNITYQNSRINFSHAIAKPQANIAYNQQALANLCLEKKDYSGAMTLLQEARDYAWRALENDHKNKAYQTSAEQLEKNINIVREWQRNFAAPATPGLRL